MALPGRSVAECGFHSGLKPPPNNPAFQEDSAAAGGESPGQPGVGLQEQDGQAGSPGSVTPPQALGSWEHGVCPTLTLPWCK